MTDEYQVEGLDEGSPDQAAGPDIMTVDQVAAWLQIGARSVYNMAAAHEIPAAKVGGQWRFYRPVIERWLTALSLKDYVGPALPEDQVAERGDHAGL